MRLSSVASRYDYAIGTSSVMNEMQFEMSTNFNSSGRMTSRYRGFVERQRNLLRVVEPQFGYTIVVSLPAERRRSRDEMALHVLAHMPHELRNTSY